jgi:hypothetical protein
MLVYAKSLVALVGAGATGLLALGESFCGSYWPAFTGVLTAVLVWAVPNRPKV